MEPGKTYLFDRAAILAHSGPAYLKREEIDVPELGGRMIVREMSGAERDRYEELHASAKYRNFRARTAAFALCDDAGQFLFAEADVEALGKLPATALDRVYEAAKRVNALTPADVEALEKN